MPEFRKMDPTSQRDAEDYLRLLERAQTVPSVANALPEIFAEQTVGQVQAALRHTRRDLVFVYGQPVGRAEYSDSLNHDPSVIDKYPAHVKLGMNTCYFMLPSTFGFSHEMLQVLVAVRAIANAFDLQSDKEASPWLPVEPKADPSRGWLAVHPALSAFAVHSGPAVTGWLPQYGIADQFLQPVYAQHKA